MLQALRSRRLAFLALAAFLMAQPVVGCAALCLFQQHPAQHEMTGMGSGGAATGGTACHTGVTDADHHSPLQVLSPMMPARAPVIAAVPAHAVDPLEVRPALPALVSHTVEPPPPRLV